MPLYSTAPCLKCGADRWRLLTVSPRAPYLEFSCLYCGTTKKIDCTEGKNE